MPDPLLDVRAIDAFYGDFQALFGVSLRVDAGEVVAVIGANGAGKSTLLKSIAGMMPPRHGEILFDGEPIGGRARFRGGQARHCAGAGRPPAVSLADGRGKSADRRPVAPPRPVDARTRLRACSRCWPSGAICPRRRFPAASSRWCAIGRALMSNPRLLLCDEISLGLAPIIVRDIYARLPAIVARRAVADHRRAGHRAGAQGRDQVYCLQEGRVALQGAARELTRERISAAYFGV